MRARARLQVRMVRAVRVQVRVKVSVKVWVKLKVRQGVARSAGYALPEARCGRER